MKKKGKKLITTAGLRKLKKELKRRTTVIRKEIADELDEAKAIGDLSENIAYTAAIEDYQFNETRIRDLKELLSKLKVAPDRSGDLSVDIGDKVKVRDVKSDKTLTYSIVGEGEGDPAKNQVSASSVVGKALLGQKKGAKVKVKLPLGEKEYEILEVA